MQRSVSRTLATASLLLAAALLPVTALAALGRVGPTSPEHGFPEWFQDTTGVTLDFCTPLNQAELDGGWCLLLPGDIIPPENQTVPPTAEVPEDFPSRFAGEHFWWAGEVATDWNTPTTLGRQPRVRLVLALEAAFATGETAIPGDQVVFGRLRVRVDNIPVTGDYKFITPYGTWTFHGTAGERIFETRDIGISCAPGDFSCALQSDLGPFLLPSDTPGGAELPPIPGPVPGKLYIADPGRLGPVTGSPIGVNYFRIEGPQGTVPFHTVDFSLVGRLFDGTLPARANIDRATYARTNVARSVEGFATANPTTPGRLPGGAIAPPVTPVLDFFPAPCGGGEPVPGCTGAFCALTPYTAPAGVAAVPMARTGSAYWAKTNPDAVPAAVCVAYTNPKTGTGADAPPFYMPAPLGDQIIVDEASYNPFTRSLTVRATSLDGVSNPALSFASFGGLGPWPLTNGVAVVPNVDAPPATARVVSTEGGSNELQVSTAVRPATGVTVTANLTSPQTAGTPVVFTASGQGASGYEYKFWLYDGTSWQVVQDYSTDATWELDASRPAGTYFVTAYVRTSPNVGMDAEGGFGPMVLQAAPTPATGVDIQASVTGDTVTAGTPITFTAAGVGGSGAYQYRFWLYDGTAWQIVRDYSTEPTWTLPGWAAPGAYVVTVYVRTSPGVILDAEAGIGPYFVVAP